MKHTRRIFALALPVALCTACLLAAVLTLAPVLASYQPLLSQQSPRDLRTGGQLETGRFTTFTQAPEAGSPGDTVDMEALGGWPAYGEQIGRVEIRGTGVDAELYYGDGDAQLHYGAGIWDGACIPGQGGTVLVAGHTATHFRDFESAEAGGEIVLSTYWGEYVYRITDIQIADADDTAAYDLERSEENIILYTCYPFNSLGYTPYRCYIYGEAVSGPTLAPATGAEGGGQ